MSKAPEFVVTGLHVPNVHFWARVLVSPYRLTQVKESILRTGTAHLHRDDVLEIETQCGDDKGLALRVNLRNSDGSYGLLPEGFCLVAWNGIAGSVNIYGDNQDELAAMYGPILDALLNRDRVVVGQAFLDADKITSIVVGGVTIFFERETKEAPAAEPDEDAAYIASMQRQSELKAALDAERLNGLKLRRFTPARGAAS